MIEDPAFWGFCGVVVTGIVAIVVEQMRHRHTTHKVLSTLEELKSDVSAVSVRLDEHIKWHLTHSQYVYVKPRREH